MSDILFDRKKMWLDTKKQIVILLGSDQGCDLKLFNLQTWFLSSFVGNQSNKWLQSQITCFKD